MRGALRCPTGNHPPVAADDAATTLQGVPVNINVLANDTDVDNDRLMVTAVTQGRSGAVSINTDGTVHYAPSATCGGSTDTFRYTIGDGRGGTSTATVTVTVTRPNRPPTCAQARPSTAELWPPNHRTVSVSVLGVSDPDGDPVSITITGIQQDESTNLIGSGNTCKFVKLA